MKVSEAEIGMKVTWNSIVDQTPMAGTVEFLGYDDLYVETVAGSHCKVSTSRCHQASLDELDNAIRVFCPDWRPWGVTV